MTNELTITKFVFDDWWTDTYGYRIEGLLAQEIEALVDHHWRELQAAAIRHSLRELEKETKEDYADVKEVCHEASADGPVIITEAELIHAIRRG